MVVAVLDKNSVLTLECFLSQTIFLPLIFPNLQWCGWKLWKN